MCNLGLPPALQVLGQIWCSASGPSICCWLAPSGLTRPCLLQPSCVPPAAVNKYELWATNEVGTKIGPVSSVSVSLPACKSTSLSRAKSA